MNRRGFLGAILAAGVAPAIVRASSLMRIFAPSQAIILPTLSEIIQTTFRNRAPEIAANISLSNDLLGLMSLIGEKERELNALMLSTMERDFGAVGSASGTVVGGL